MKKLILTWVLTVGFVLFVVAAFSAVQAEPTQTYFDETVNADGKFAKNLDWFHKIQPGDFVRFQNKHATKAQRVCIKRDQIWWACDIPANLGGWTPNWEFNQGTHKDPIFVSMGTVDASKYSAWTQSAPGECGCKDAISQIQPWKYFPSLTNVGLIILTVLIIATGVYLMRRKIGLAKG